MRSAKKCGETTTLTPMTPDPAKPVSSVSRRPMAPPYVDEDANEAMVEQGLEVAEDELRDVVADSYEEGAREAGDPEQMMDDIDYGEAEEDGGTAEIEAIHGELVPEEEE
jgi:hypothetical protein